MKIQHTKPWDAAKAAAESRGKFIVINALLKKEARFQGKKNNLTHQRIKKMKNKLSCGSLSNIHIQLCIKI